MIRTILLLIISFSTSAHIDYLGEKKPTSFATPILFGAGIISTGDYERDFTLSPDGTEMYFSIKYAFNRSVIVYTKLVGGKWSRIKTASFSNINKIDLEPSFSPDGKRLFFASKRNGSFDIWYVERLSNGSWSEPVEAGDNINTIANEFYPSVTNDGSLFFTASYGDNENIWKSELQDGIYLVPVAIPSPVNTSRNEFNAYVSPDGSEIYFGTEETGGGDIYRSTKCSMNWTAPDKLIINSSSLDYSPSKSPDKTFIFFTSERETTTYHASNPFDFVNVIKAQNWPKGGEGNIYWSRINNVHE